ncbi:MAG: hypothetical protein MJ016_08005 [Victivallaceae bacterium]|nr:hypothetical protein [Victivallaceae bacterium]
MSSIRENLVISLFGVVPQSDVAFGFCGSTVAGSVRSVETPVEALLCCVCYRVRHVAETFCCTVYGYCRRVTAIARRLWHRAGNFYPLSFERRSRTVLGWRL